MTERVKWNFVADPLQPNICRLFEGDPHDPAARIIGAVAREADAKLICDAVNGLKPE